ncbi:hypothetical protein RJ639_043413 [Escallonia herrerae]|uniref:Secreted protein n=1 Tax=Escallonia herrerae TaxID=1293975 RepID=A0AA88WBH5_9ASTE|nr:hypothetical protein RJ639_043413 [Escallonia herrerae]
MAIYKAVVAALLVSFVVFHFVQADQMMETNGIARSLLQTIGTARFCLQKFEYAQIVERHALSGVQKLRGKRCASGPAGLAANAATACHQALPVTQKHAPAMPT